ncbi:MAG: hypothetical protein MZW92_21840 [Comamonadaceae bacterium]|nr:hypothetical protein [Comamonadaceae bacterium]
MEKFKRPVERLLWRCIIGENRDPARVSAVPAVPRDPSGYRDALFNGQNIRSTASRNSHYIHATRFRIANATCGAANQSTGLREERTCQGNSNRFPLGASAPVSVSGKPAVKGKEQRVTLNDAATSVADGLQEGACAHHPGHGHHAERAKNKMIANGMRLLLVVDILAGIVSLITSTDILSEKPVRVVNERRISRAEESRGG